MKQWRFQTKEEREKVIQERWSKFWLTMAITIYASFILYALFH